MIATEHDPLLAPGSRSIAGTVNEEGPSFWQSML
jgi:hypothetical protein